MLRHRQTAATITVPTGGVDGVLVSSVVTIPQSPSSKNWKWNKRRRQRRPSKWHNHHTLARSILLPLLVLFACAVSVVFYTWMLRYDGTSNNGTSSEAIHEAHWRELDLDNFASVIGASAITLVLFHDREDHTESTESEHAILQKLALEYSKDENDKDIMAEKWKSEGEKLTFAKIDNRRHQWLRDTYLPNNSLGGYDKFYMDYLQVFSGVPRDPIPPTLINSSTFMSQPEEELPKFPSHWLLFNGENFNVYGFEKKAVAETLNSKKKPGEELLSTGYNELDFDDKYKIIKNWLVAEKGNLKANRVLRKSQFSYIMMSQIELEKYDKEVYDKKDTMNDINWEAARTLGEEGDKGTDMQDDLDLDLFRIERDDAGDTFYKYEEDPEYYRIKGASTDEILEELSRAIADFYLVSNDSYENLWDSERKAREDKMTNYGLYLEKLNQKVRKIIFSQLDDEGSVGKDNQNTTSEIPDLKRYFEDLLFGYGRSSTTFDKYLKDVVYKAKGDVKDLDLFERIREYMRVLEEIYTPVPGSRNRAKYICKYKKFFGELQTKLSSALAEFYNSLSAHYAAYLKQNPEARQNHWNFAKLDIIDMTDPSNFNLMTDYDEFDRRYTAKRKPVILSNTWLEKPNNYTLEFLVEKCGAMDVTMSVKTSFRLGDKEASDWGGLESFELPENLVGSNSSNKPLLGRNIQPNKITLEQFVELTKSLDYLYLHDHTLEHGCSTVLSSKGIYDSNDKQYFKMPSVIARYDLVQKTPFSPFLGSWPSLFIGRKGTNSKIHIDSSNTGFWMYLISGRKRWVVFDVAEIPFLYRRPDGDSFLADPLALGSSADENIKRKVKEGYDATYPLLGRATSESRAYEIIQEPGQLVYIPPGSPHAVENLEDTVGIAMNFIPRSGISSYLHNVLHHDHEVGILEINLRYLMSSEDRYSLAKSEDPLYTTLGEYKAQG